MKKGVTLKEKEAKENTATTTSYGEIYLLCENNNIDVAHHDLTWMINIVASYHVTPSGEWFNSDEEGEFGYLKMGNK